MKKKYLICILLIIIILIPTTFLIFQEEIEVKKDLQHRRFKDINIISAKKPTNTHLWLEINSAGSFYFVADGELTHLYYSDDKMDTEAKIDVDPGDAHGGDNDHRPANIISAWHDRANKIIYFVDHSGGNTIYSWKLDYSVSESTPTVTEMGTVAGLNTVGDVDIFMIGSDIFMWYVDTLELTVVKWVDPNWVNQDTAGSTSHPLSYVVVVGTIAYILLDAAPVILFSYTNGTTTMASIETFIGKSLPGSENLIGITYDGSNILNFILNLDADGKNYLYSYNISGDSQIQHGEFNVALMLDRNNIGTVPNEFEKGFSTGASETVYEIKARRGGIRQLQDMSAITDTVIIAITDNFLMNDDGDMFEFAEVEREVTTILYTDGIIGVEKRGIFTVHPDFHINWNIGDSIKIYDQYDQLEFHGLINDKNRNSRGIYVYKIDSFTNEIFRKTYENIYSGDDTDTKQKDIIDNGCDFCYRDSSIVGTTTTYDYAYNRDLIYLFWLARFLERQVPYIEPDGKIWTKAHDGLVRNDMIYGATYNFKDDADGSVPSGWTDADGVGCESTIIGSLDGHRKLIQLDDQGAGACLIHRNFTQQADQTLEFWVGKDNIANDKDFTIAFNEDAEGLILFLQFHEDDFRYNDGANHNIITGGIVVDTLINVKLVLNDTANTYDIYIDGVLIIADANYINNTAISLDRIVLQTNGADTGYKNYFDAFGFSVDPAYNIGDNEVVWDIANHWQEVFLVDIPGLEEKIQGFFDGNSGITRNTIRYRDNTTTIRPIAATRDPIEQLKGILALNEFRDPKIEAVTEAEQLGDNRYAIFSSDIIFLGLRIEGQGYLQPGKTIEIENTGEITIVKNDYLVISFERDPKNDVYINMILSDNIIFPAEFSNLQNTSAIQIHTASVQALENQFDINLHLTKEGGLALRLTNKTGGASVKGTIVEADAAVNNAFNIADANSVESFGVVYEDGIADGSECLVVIGGRVQVLLKDATLSTRHNWVHVSDVAGRANATLASPAAAPQHFKEIGHAIESKGADTDVLAYIMLHFL